MASQNPNQQSQRKTRETEHNGEAEMKDRGNDILRDTLEEFRERSDDVKTLVTEYVQDKPMKALGIALVAGMALALFMRR